MKRILFTVLCLLPLSVMAAGKQVRIEQIHRWNTTPAIDDGTLNTACTNITTDAPGCTSVVLNTRGLESLCMEIVYTKNAGTEFNMYVDHRFGSGLPWGALQAGDGSFVPRFRMGTHNPYWDTSSQSGTAAWFTCFDVYAPDTRLRFVATGANGSDAFDLYVVQSGG